MSKFCRKENLDMGVKEEVLLAAKEVIESKGRNEFMINEVMNYMKNKKTKYKVPTIRSQIVSRCYI
jgi:cytochrome c peroxidase